MTSLREKIEDDPIGYLVTSIIGAAITTGVIVSAGWAYWGDSGVDSESRSSSLSFQLQAERDRYSQCQESLDKRLSKEIKLASDLAVQKAKLGAEKEACNNRVLDEKYKLTKSNYRNRLLSDNLSSVNSALKEKVAVLEKEKAELEKITVKLENKTLKLEKETAELNEEISSYSEKYDASIEMQKIDDKYKQLIEKLDVAFSEHKANQEKIGVYTHECNSSPSINYLGSCKSLKEAILKKESYELQIAGYQQMLDNYQKRLLKLNKKLTDI